MTPTVIDNISRFFTGVFDEQKITMSGRCFSGFFGRPGVGSQVITNQYAFDDNIIRSDKKISKMVPRDDNFSQHLGSLIKTLRPGNYSKLSRNFPLCVEHFALTKADLQTMAPFEHDPYPGPDIEQSRMRYYSMRAIKEIRRRSEDMCNILAAQSILEGIQDKIIDTTIDEDQYTWHRAAGNFITVGTVWSNVAADIKGDLADAARQAHRQGKITQNQPLIVGLSPAVMEYVKLNTAIKAEADNRRFVTVNVDPEMQVPTSHQFMVQNGWTFQARMNTEGWSFYFYTTEDYYENDSNVKTSIMPDTKAFVTSPMVQMDSIFGPPTTFDMSMEKIRMFTDWFGFNPMMPPAGNSTNDGQFQIIPNDAYHIIGATDKWGTAREFAVQLAPVFKTTHTDGIVTLLGVTT